MNDREMLELAARAVGERVPPRFYPDDSAVLISGQRWNPLTDDGDALKLAVKLDFTVRCWAGSACAQSGAPGSVAVYICETNEADPLAATRRAITRAAAEIGKVKS